MTQGIDPSFALPAVMALVVIPDSRPFGWIQASGLQGKPQRGIAIAVEGGRNPEP